MTATSSTADVSTDRPARYGKQLTAHLGRRNGGEWSEADERGWVQLGDGRAELSCSPGTLHLRVDLGPEASADSLPRLEDVVGRHLVRFGSRDELVVSWVHADGEPGSTQRMAED